MTGAGASDAFLGKRQTLALFAFIVVAFVLLAYRSEVNAENIKKDGERISRNQVQSCQISRVILVKFNAEQQTLADIDRVNPDINEEIRAARVEAYMDAMLPVPDCENLR